jgi:hypothetical protein
MVVQIAHISSAAPADVERYGYYYYYALYPVVGGMTA